MILNGMSLFCALWTCGRLGVKAFGIKTITLKPDRVRSFAEHFGNEMEKILIYGFPQKSSTKSWIWPYRFPYIPLLKKIYI